MQVHTAETLEECDTCAALLARERHDCTDECRRLILSDYLDGILDRRLEIMRASAPRVRLGDQ